MKFIIMVWLAFFARQRPVSTMAKPACMNMTRKPATSVQTKLMAVVLSATDLAMSSSLGGGAASASSRAMVARVMALLERKDLAESVCKPGTTPDAQRRP